MINYIFLIISICYSIKVLITALNRKGTISELPSDVINKDDKKDYENKLLKYILVLLGCLIIGIIGFILPFIPLKICICLISILTASNINIKIIDETEDFNISKEDNDKLNDFNQKTQEDIDNIEQKIKIKNEEK